MESSCEIMWHKNARNKKRFSHYKTFSDELKMHTRKMLIERNETRKGGK